MAAPPPTVPALKQSFLAAQVAILAQPPVPSDAWLAANAASDCPVPPRALDDALQALRHRIQEHCRRVYPPQASRNVAHQIASVYARDAERKVGADGHVDGAVYKHLDLADDVVIEALPSSWPLEREINDFPMEARRYLETTSRLSRLSEERKVLRQRLAVLRRLKESLDPFSTTDGAAVQENLITRDGPVEMELEKMRFLLARVSGRLTELPPTSPCGDTVELASVHDARKRTVDDFLADSDAFPS